MDVSSSQRTVVTHKSKHMVAWLLKNEFVSATDFRISHYRKRTSVKQSDTSLRKIVLQSRLQQLATRRHSLQHKDLELRFRRDDLRRRADELFYNGDCGSRRKNSNTGRLSQWLTMFCNLLVTSLWMWWVFFVQCMGHDVSVSPAKKPRMGVSSLIPVQKHLTKTSTTQTSSSLLTRVTSQEVLFYTRNGVRCTWC